MQIEAIERQTTADLVVERIAGVIKEQNLSAGERLPGDRSSPTQVYDIHATILHLLGIDHTRLTVRHDGIDRRLTDVHGHVIREILS